MADTGGCPNCGRPKARHERVCVACGYSRDHGGVVATRERGRSVGDVLLYAMGRVLLHPVCLGLIGSGFAVVLALHSAGDPKAAWSYSSLSGAVCVVAGILQWRHFSCEASIEQAASMRLFGWLAVVFSGEASPLLRVLTLIAVTMAAATGLLHLGLPRSPATP